jgi:hypothetical protein
MINLMYFPNSARGIIGSFVVTGPSDCINISVIDGDDSSECLVGAVKKVEDARNTEISRALAASINGASKKEIAAMCNEVIEHYPDNKSIFEIFSKLKRDEIL